jgi:hypothetical protein
MCRVSSNLEVAKPRLVLVPKTMLVGKVEMPIRVKIVEVVEAR